MQLPNLKTTCILALPIAGLQLLRGPSTMNPPVVASHTIQANLRITPAVSGIITRACADCHSNQTRWPWYSRIPPLSWPIAADVHKARAAMNLSEWSNGMGRKPEIAISALAAACADVNAGTMPLPRYLMLHPSARLSAADRQMFCEWTHEEITRLAAVRRSALARR